MIARSDENLSLASIGGDALDFRYALEAAKLPTDDLLDGGRVFYGASRDGQTVGFGGYEMHGKNALLRSVVILPEFRGAGIGYVLAEMLLAQIRDDGGRNADLLTDTATPFFEAPGFRRVQRSDAPQEILATRQAASLCSSSATLLAKKLAEQ